MCAVAVFVFINVVLWDSLSPGRTTLEFNVVGVDAGVNDVDVNAFTTRRIIFVLGEGAESELWPVADAGESLGSDNNPLAPERL